MIQKYEEISRGRTVVSVALGDLGVGVRASLRARHGEIGREPLGYLREAMGGRVFHRLLTDLFLTVINQSSVCAFPFQVALR